MATNHNPTKAGPKTANLQKIKREQSWVEPRNRLAPIKMNNFFIFVEAIFIYH
jgi:hypothetical protein